MLGEEISRVIQEQRALEKKYEQLIEERRNMKGLSNRAKFQANEDEIQRTANALRQSTKILTRNLQDNPNVEGNMHKIQSERSALETLLVNTAHELQFAYAPALAPYPRTDRTRRVPHPVLIGHVPHPVGGGHAVRRACRRGAARRERERVRARGRPLRRDPSPPAQDGRADGRAADARGAHDAVARGRRAGQRAAPQQPAVCRAVCDVICRRVREIAR